jgi:hypothetical protein
MDANAELQRYAGRNLRKFLLNCDGAAHGADHAREFSEYAIAGGICDAAAMVRDAGIHPRQA